MSVSQNEVDDLLASMETNILSGTTTSSPRTLDFQPSLVLLQPDSSQRSSSPRPATDQFVTGARGVGLHRPSLSSSPRLTPQSSLSALSSPRGSSSKTLLPAVGSGSFGSSPRSASTTASVTTPSMSISLLQSDLDALAAALESDDPVTTAENIAVVDALLALTSTDHEEVVDHVTVLPPFLSSAPRSFSNSMARIGSSSSEGSNPMMIKKHVSLGRLTTMSEVDPILAPPHTPHNNGRSPRSQLNKSLSPSRRRLTIAANEISHHALERLGVNTDILKKEKGMKKLGICDDDIERSEELRRYSGIPLSHAQTTKPELIFGFTREQLLRVKAMNRLGTSEEEVMDEYSRRVSRLGTHEPPILHSIK